MIDNTDMLNTVSYVEVAKVETKQAVKYQSKAWRVSNLTKRYNKTKKKCPRNYFHIFKMSSDSLFLFYLFLSLLFPWRRWNSVWND